MAAAMRRSGGRGWLLLVLLLLLAVASIPLRDQFLDDASFRRSYPERFQRVANGSTVLTLVSVFVVLLRPRVLRFVRSRSWHLADAQEVGGWRALTWTAVLNAVYVVAVAGPGRWVVTAALTAYATGSERFQAPSEVVAEAAARYVDRGTGLLLLAMAAHAGLVHLDARSHRSRGQRD
ncbi:hypothetical protein [Cellulomonas sp. IC4_254]|uniref:hypothetical protein n=1 Tax=Cellulomonas sp. IC4_254 TaxID=2714040 RepID=UPI00141DF4F7|nr:hypothetical protein [Cellulomonas sp. IC4_254]NHT16918.1 hypothetical protein [Cellulomonas sp. IC4_254]